MGDRSDVKSASEKYIVNYHIITELASSTSSRVFLAKHDVSMQSAVVVKLFYSTSIDTQREVACFLAEISALRQLKHPFILPIIDVGIDKVTPYTVTPHLTSGSLYERIQHAFTQPAPIEDTVNILFQIGQALHYAHQKHVFHGNLKPRNILFNKDGQIQVADFTFTAARKTVSGSSLINPDAAFYMAPELFMHEPDALSDQYALGCLAYELFTGRRPFDALFSSEQQREDPPTPTLFQPHIPFYIEDAILKAIAREPEQRHFDINAFINALMVPSYSVNVEKARIASSPLHLLNKEEKLLAIVSAPTEEISLSALVEKESRIEITEHDTPALSLRKSEEHLISPPRTSKKLRRYKLLLLTLCIAAVVLSGGVLSSSFLFAQASRNPLIRSTLTATTSDSKGKMSVKATPTAINTSSMQPIAQSPSITQPPSTVAVPTRVVTIQHAITPASQPMTNSGQLQVSPTHFMPANCVVDNSNYRCTATLQLSNQFQSQLNWQVVTPGISTRFNTTSGTISPGMTQQVIIYIYADCPRSGRIIFSGAGDSATATWNC